MLSLLASMVILVNQNSLPPLIPSPRNVDLTGGSYTLPRTPTVSAPEGWLPLVRKALAGRGRAASQEGDIRLVRNQGIVGDEAYRMTVGAEGIQIESSTDKGLFYGLQTLRQLARSKEIPCLRIEDAPAFAWRGVMVDEGRHFMGVKTVKKVLDAMALHKMNVLHWHLTEDQGWRIEIKKHPNLTETGAWRREPDGTRYGGFYTQDQIREIVRYAAERHIMVVPEIELPGHCTAAIAAYPELGCRNAPLEVPTTWGIFSDVYCAGRESTFRFLEDVIGEVVALFPSPYFHIGGDEVPKSNWKECPDCQRRIKAEGLKDEHELQSYFVRRIQSFLSGKGRRLIGWDEILEGGLAKGAVVQVWQDQSRAVPARAEGADIILSPSSFTYLNRDAANLTMEEVYAYEPMQGLKADDRDNILGVETPLWSEGITHHNLVPKLFPRGLAIAEIGWSDPKKDYAGFQKRVEQHLALLEEEGVPYGAQDRSLYRFWLQSDRASGGAILNAEGGLPDIVFRYRTDGRKPTGSSPSFQGRLPLPIGAKVSVAPFRGKTALGEPTRFETLSHLAQGKPVTLAAEPEPRYAKGGAGNLTDGLLGGSNFGDGQWLGWEGENLEAVVDLGKSTEIRSVALRCFQQTKNWIVMPKWVDAEVSNDGKEWRSLGRRMNDVPDRSDHILFHWFEVKASKAIQARYVRVRAECYGKLPSWHLGAGGDSFLFADEIVVR